jgi:2-dehydropantoate 2-reductase
MKIAVIGAGAIGGYVGAKLALAGEDVTFIVRGANLEAIKARGIKLIDHDGTEHVAPDVKATNDYAEAGVQELVILALKAHQVDSVADQIGRLIGPDTVVVTMQNGIPFWYFHQHGGPHDGRTVTSVDPTGLLASKISPAHILGCVVYPAAELIAPGVIQHVEGERFPLGELDGSISARAQAISEVFQHAGLKAPVLDNIRAEIWLKLWGNRCFNPISALSHSTLVDICQFPLTRELAAEMMREAQAVAGELGITFRVTLERRIEGAEKVGKHKTSMLQDVEAGRGPEIDALVGSVVEMGRLTGIPTPHIDTAYALVKLLECSMNEGHGGVRLQTNVAA